MRKTGRILCNIFIIGACMNLNAQNTDSKLVGYTLDANSKITKCDVTATKRSGVLGTIESIQGSTLNMQINPGNTYKIEINNDEVYFIEHKVGEGFVATSSINKLALYNSETFTNALIYRVQVGAFHKSSPVDQFGEALFNTFKNADDSIISNLGEVFTEQVDGATIYMIGSFNSQEEALKAQIKIRELGNKNAFSVICYNNKIISSDEAQKIIEEQSNLMVNN